MSVIPLAFEIEPSDIPTDPKGRHEAFVDFFGRWLFKIRNNSLEKTRAILESEEIREGLGTVRRKYYDGVAAMTDEQRHAAMLMLEETLNGFIERLAWSLGNEGTDARFGNECAYRFRVEMEIVNVESGEAVITEPINRGGKFFGTYCGRWLNRYRHL